MEVGAKYCCLIAALQLLCATGGRVATAVHSFPGTQKRQATDPTIEVDPDLTQVGEDVGSIRGCIIGGSYSVQVEVRTVDFCDFEEEEVACDGTDYTGLDIAITLDPGERRCFAVNITDDAIAERHEVFQIELVVGGQTLFYAITIIDNDAPTLEVQSNSTVSEDVGSVEICAVGGDAVLTVLLVATSHCSSYHACEDSDYIGHNITVMVGPGERTCSDVEILDDTTAEPMEELSFCLESAEFPHILMDCISIAIVDDDAPRLLLQAPHMVLENAGSVEVCVTGGRASSVEVTLQTSSSCHLTGDQCVAATEDKDYIAVKEELTITSGETQCRALELVDDAETEGEETVRVGLWDFQSSGVFYDLIDIVIIDDDVTCEPECGSNGSCSYPGICVCNPGWTGEICDEDIDECAKDNGGCTDKCSNLPGGYTCSCEENKSQLKEDQHTCSGSPISSYTDVYGLWLWMSLLPTVLRILL